MARKPAPPPEKSPGERLAESIESSFELDDHERVLLEQAAQTLDLLVDLQAALDAAGPLMDSPQGLKAHPAAVELRQQRIALARLFAALRIPVDQGRDGAVRLQRRGPRGVYGGAA